MAARVSPVIGFESDSHRVVAEIGWNRVETPSPQSEGVFCVQGGDDFDSRWYRRDGLGARLSVGVTTCGPADDGRVTSVGATGCGPCSESSVKF